VVSDNGEEEDQFRPFETPVPAVEGDDGAPPSTINVEPIRRLLRQEILVVRQELRQEIRAELHIGHCRTREHLKAMSASFPARPKRS
jgi:hypothetical protein